MRDVSFRRDTGKAYNTRVTGWPAHAVDLDDIAIGSLFKLYPLEDLFSDPFGLELLRSNLQFLDPAWKLALSNKGVLPLLWERHRGHPNLLEAYFDDGAPLRPGWVRKPLLSR